ncbi:MAG: hypothetical protein SWO11_03410 [Thermodesulfobacteriota bacterium]|nr:hypothetical protein [Thermodesulfobacteriota bacterium]
MITFWSKRILFLKRLMGLHLVTFICFLLGVLFIQTYNAHTACNPQFEQVNINGFGNISNRYSWSMKVFNNYLYVGTRNHDDGGEIWRYDGTDWENVVSGGFTSMNNTGFRNMAVLNGAIYAGTNNEISGAELIRSFDGTNWEVVIDNGFGNMENASIRGMKVFIGYLYIGLQNTADGPGQLFRTEDGTNFTPVTLDGFGNTDNASIHTLEVFNGRLYAATKNREGGLQVWRNSDVDGLIFEMVVGPGAATSEGFGNKRGNRTPMDMHIFNGQMYIGSINAGRGFGVWRTSDGLTYEQVVFNGFGDFGNAYPWRFETYENHIWLGTFNYLNIIFNKGGSLWRSSTGNLDEWEEMIGRHGIYMGYGFDNPCVWGIRSFAVFQGKLYIGTAINKWCRIKKYLGTEIWEWPGEECP